MKTFNSVALKTLQGKSNDLIIFRMSKLGIAREGGSVCFGQLLGMCDHVSLTLGKYHHSPLQCKE